MRVAHENEPGGGPGLPVVPSPVKVLVLLFAVLGLLLLARFRPGTTRQAWALSGALAGLVVVLAIPALTPFTAEHLASGVFRTGLADRERADRNSCRHLGDREQ